MRNRIISILLLFALFAPAASMYCWLHFRKTSVRQWVKKQITSGIDPGALVLLEFSKATIQTELHWEHDHEFEYRGHMYDVVKTEAAGDTIRYWCWPDDEETDLNQQIRAMLPDSDDAFPWENGTFERLHSYFKTLICANYPLRNIQFPVSGAVQIFHYLNGYSEFTIPPPKPPPPELIRYNPCMSRRRIRVIRVPILLARQNSADLEG